MNRSETAALLSKLSSVWPNQRISDDTITAWVWAFEDAPAELVEDAGKQWLRGGKPFFPAPSDLRAIIAGEIIGPAFVPEAAWGEVKRQALRFPYGIAKVYDPESNASVPNPGPTFSHPLIAAAVEATGWRLICHADEEDETIVKAQFTKTLQALTARAGQTIKGADLSGPLGELRDPANVRRLREKSA